MEDKPGQFSDKPKVTVIIPAYNKANLLPRTIKSVLNQTFKNIELIIVNDAAIDNTDEVVRSFNDNRIVYIKHKENRGFFGALNTGLDAMRGEYVVFLSDDDELLLDAAETIVSKFTELSPKGIKILLFDCIDAETGKYSGSGIRKEGYVSYEDFLCDRIQGDYWIAIDKRAIDNNRFDQTLWGYMCSILLLKLYRNNKVFYIPKILGKAHREHKENRIATPEVLFKNISRVVLTEKAYLKEYGEETKPLCRKYYGQRLASLGFYQILNNEKKEGRSNVLESFRFHFSLAHCAIFILSFILDNNQLKFICLKFFKIKEAIRKF
jgi:GalNAc5-diNAcBac-PP-undecaprenol beta-1,3-glucosyltransferase